MVTSTKKSKRTFDQRSEGKNISREPQSPPSTSKTNPQRKTRGEPTKMLAAGWKRFTGKASSSISTSQDLAYAVPASRSRHSSKREIENERLREDETEDGININISKPKPGEDTQMADAPSLPSHGRSDPPIPNSLISTPNVRESSYAQAASRHPGLSEETNLRELVAEKERLIGNLEGKIHSMRELVAEKEMLFRSLEDENSKLKEDIAKSNDEVQKEKTTWGEIQTKLHSEIAELQRKNATLSQHFEKVKQTNSDQAKRLSSAHSHIKTTDAQLKQFDTWIAQLKSKVATLENDKAGYQSQIEKMSQIVSQLNKKGLPLPPDDSYFTQELGSLISDIRQWARLFTKGRPALSTDDLDIIQKQLPEKMVDHLYNSFVDLSDLINSPSVGTKVRTRCVEAILLRSLTGSYLYKRYIGMDEEMYATLQSIFKHLNASDEERQYWSALTSHLLIKNNDAYLNQQRLEIDQITNYLYTHLSTAFQGNPRATKASLRNIVSRVSKIGMEIAQLPFCIRPRSFKLGCKFVPEKMEDIDGDSTSDDEEDRSGSRGGPESITPSIILSNAWMKIVFDEEGGRASHESTSSTQTIFLCKAQVSCLT